MTIIVNMLSGTISYDVPVQILSVGHLIFKEKFILIKNYCKFVNGMIICHNFGRFKIA